MEARTHTPKSSTELNTWKDGAFIIHVFRLQNQCRYTSLPLPPILVHRALLNPLARPSFHSELSSSVTSGPTGSSSASSNDLSRNAKQMVVPHSESRACYT
eukprot:6464454-Amphidinium_carterae.1